MPIIIRKKPALVVPKPLGISFAVPDPLVRKNADGKCLATVGKNRNMLVPWVLMSSYVYYIHGKDMVSDGVFDGMIERLKTNWSTIKHRHKTLITDGHLQAGTLFDLKYADYPGMVRGGAKQIMLDFHGVDIGD